MVSVRTSSGNLKEVVTIHRNGEAQANATAMPMIQMAASP